LDDVFLLASAEPCCQGLVAPSSAVADANKNEAAQLRVQVRQLEREKGAVLARAEAAEKRHKNLLTEGRDFGG
jgi:hypothetical protein